MMTKILCSFCTFLWKTRYIRLIQTQLRKSKSQMILVIINCQYFAKKSIHDSNRVRGELFLYKNVK